MSNVYTVDLSQVLSSLLKVTAFLCLRALTTKRKCTSVTLGLALPGAQMQTHEANLVISWGQSSNITSCRDKRPLNYTLGTILLNERNL